MKNYKKQQKKYIKDLTKYIKKNEKPYDFYQLIDVLLMMLKRRLEYFENGDNVYQSDDYRLHTIETLKKAIELGEYANNDENFEFQDVKEYCALSDEQIKNTPFPSHNISEYIEMDQKMKQAYKNWFCYIVDSMYGWWD